MEDDKIINKTKNEKNNSTTKESAAQQDSTTATTNTTTASSLTTALVQSKPQTTSSSGEVETPQQNQIPEKSSITTATTTVGTTKPSSDVPAKNTSTMASGASGTVSGDNRKKRKIGSTGGSGGAGVNHKKSRKKRAKREDGAPKMPLTGYVRYMNKRRDALRLEFPEKSAIEHTKIIAEEWNSLSDELKKPFLKEAEIDKERYSQQMGEFNKQKYELRKAEIETENNQRNANIGISLKSINDDGNRIQANGGSTSTGAVVAGSGIKTTNPDNKSQMNGGTNVSTTTNTISSSMTTTSNSFARKRRSGEYGIPIFTDEFLEHNKSVDIELRTLRKSNIDYEQQNSVLEKHIENMKFGVEKIENENNELTIKNRLLENYLDKFKQKLIQAFAGLPIPTQPNGATLENIDNYMTDLHNMATSNSHGPASLNKAKDIIRKLDLQIQL